jgi:hypothetical protein
VIKGNENDNFYADHYNPTLVVDINSSGFADKIAALDASMGENTATGVKKVGVKGRNK